MKQILWNFWPMWVAVFSNLVATFYTFRRARRLRDEWVRLRALNQIVWSYTKELVERGVTLPPRCCMCCQILPRHVDGCVMVERVPLNEAAARIKYYAKGEHPPHPEEEPPTRRVG